MINEKPVRVPTGVLKQKPKIGQAERVIAKFGGARRLAAILKELDPLNFRSPSSIYRWLYPRERGGTDGVIPTSALPLVIRASRMEGIFLSSDDLFPGAR